MPTIPMIPTTTPINLLGLKPRTLNALLATGRYPTVGHLAPTDRWTLLGISGIGQAGVKDIKERLAFYGYVLGEPLPPDAPPQNRRRRHRRRPNLMRYL